MITDAMKAAIPKVLYGCADQGCAELVSHYPEDLFWWQDGFYCDACIGRIVAKRRKPARVSRPCWRERHEAS